RRPLVRRGGRGAGRSGPAPSTGRPRADPPLRHALGSARQRPDLRPPPGRRGRLSRGRPAGRGRAPDRRSSVAVGGATGRIRHPSQATPDLRTMATRWLARDDPVTALADGSKDRPMAPLGTLIVSLGTLILLDLAALQ